MKVEWRNKRDSEYTTFKEKMLIYNLIQPTFCGLIQILGNDAKESEKDI